MYTSYEEAADSIVMAMQKLHREKIPGKDLIVRSLRADTGGHLNRIDYLTNERIMQILSRREQTPKAIVQVLFPSTWNLISK
jgi:hypothetical protein